MAAGRISLVLNPGGNLHLVFLDASTNFPFEFIQPPNNIWGPKKPVPNLDSPIPFQAIKIVRGAGSVVEIVALDTTGRLWFNTSNDSSGWSNNFTLLPNQNGLTFTRFDATFIPFIGIVVAAVSNGQAFTQTTADGINWSQPGWSNQPNQVLLYTLVPPFRTQPPAEYLGSLLPPTFSNILVFGNGDVHEGDNAPVIAGLTTSPGNLPAPGNLPLVLFNDSSNANWQWSQMPQGQSSYLSDVQGKRVTTTVNPPPYPVGFSDFHSTDGFGMFGPLLVLLGNDGNVYFDAVAGSVANWAFYGAGANKGALPNPDGLVFTKAKMAPGFVINSNTFGNLQVIAIDQAHQFPWLIWQDGNVPNPLQSNWNWAGQLPPLGSGALKVVDFDVAMGATALQVAYLTTDNTVYVNFQVQSGGWGPFGPLT